MQLNKKSLSVVEIAHTDTKTRPVLSSVRVTKEFTEASDGFRLIRVTNPPILDGIDAEKPQDFEECLISRDAIMEIKGEKDVLVDTDGTEHVVFYPGLDRASAPYTVRAKVSKVQESWPDSDTLFPHDKAGYRVLVNPYLLLGMCKIAVQFGDVMVMEFRGERGAIYVETTDDRQHMRGLIQPITPPEEPPPGDGKKPYTIRKDGKSRDSGGDK